MNMFRTLTPDEVIDFERYAYDNEPPRDNRWFIMHPVCRKLWFELARIEATGINFESLM